MKTINGETYYISLGYVEDPTKPIMGKQIKPIFIKNKKSVDRTNVYVNDEDKDNPYALPLIPVNDIQYIKKDNAYKLILIVDPTNIEFEGEIILKINICSVFKETENETIVPVGNYTSDFTIHAYDNTSMTVNVIVSKNLI